MQDYLETLRAAKFRIGLLILLSLPVWSNPLLAVVLLIAACAPDLTILAGGKVSYKGP